MDFANAAQVFAGPTFTFEDDHEDYGEQRWVTLGLLGEKVVVIVQHWLARSERHAGSTGRVVELHRAQARHHSNPGR
jgi:uncharacterized protein